MSNPYCIFPLGDSAATIELGNYINEPLNHKIIAMQRWLTQNCFEGLKDTIVAYSSLSLIYDPVLIKKKYNPAGTVFGFVHNILQEAYRNAVVVSSQMGDLIKIPVCYDDEFGIDLNAMAAQKKITKEEIIQLHTGKTYRVYMIGFLPGFPYMAEVDEKLFAVRKKEPVMVTPGSVGIAGSQTGIYPFNSPGGWNIIGRTSLQLFEPNSKNLVKLKAGDRVNFYRVSKEEMLAGLQLDY